MDFCKSFWGLCLKLGSGVSMNVHFSLAYKSFTDRLCVLGITKMSLIEKEIIYFPLWNISAPIDCFIELTLCRSEAISHFSCSKEQP